MRCPTPERAFRGGFVLPVFSFWQTVVYREVLPFVTKRKRKVPPFRRGGRRPGRFLPGRLCRPMALCAMQKSNAQRCFRNRSAAQSGQWYEAETLPNPRCGHLTTAYSPAGAGEQGMDLKYTAGKVSYQSQKEPPAREALCFACLWGFGISRTRNRSCRT